MIEEQITLKTRSLKYLEYTPDVSGDSGPESHDCVDCGVNTCPGAPPRESAKMLMDTCGSFPITYTDECEVYIVNESVWKQAGMEPSGGCLCIGCLERRIHRKLTPQDFPEHPFKSVPGTPRLRSRMALPITRLSRETFRVEPQDEWAVLDEARKHRDDISQQ